MPFIKTINVKDTVYDIKAEYDGSGNVIADTYATKTEVDNRIETLVGAAPEALDTLVELADALLDKGSEISELITAVGKKVDKVEGKELSSNDYTTAEKEKLEGITAGAEPNVVTLVAGRIGAVVLTKADVGLGNAENTTDLNKPISTATLEALDLKVDKVSGKGLSANDFTNDLKTKLDGIATGANNYTHPNTTGNKHIPAGGTTGQILVNSADGTALWQNSSSKIDALFEELNNHWELLLGAQNSLSKKIDAMSANEDLYAYGVEWDITVASPVLTRIGNPLLHKSLPIQSAYRGCIAEGATVNYYLSPNDWNFKEDEVTASVLDGTDGTVRVHIPKFYGKSGSEGNKRWVKISLVKIDDTWMEIPEMLVDAYRSTVKTDGLNSQAVSVVNTTAAYRGGGNRTANDTYLGTDRFKTDLGKPRTNLSRATMRTYASNAGSEMLCYEFYKWIFYWNYVIEYANFNSQAAYNAELTSDGYHQGGLGDGVTTWNGDWNTYNGYYPLTPCGYCNEIGNFTGLKEMIVPHTTSKTFSVPRWRGFDNPFGDIWTNLDGIVIQRPAANQLSSVYTSTLVSEFTDVIGNKISAGTETASDGYTKAYDLGTRGEIIPSAVGGSTTTYMCDYHWCNASYTGRRTLRVGGSATDGAAAGLGYFYSAGGVGDANANVGFRTLNRIA